MKFLFFDYYLFLFFYFEMLRREISYFREIILGKDWYFYQLGENFKDIGKINITYCERAFVVVVMYLVQLLCFACLYE